jgi:hypothetical protein
MWMFEKEGLCVDRQSHPPQQMKMFVRGTERGWGMGKRQTDMLMGGKEMVRVTETLSWLVMAATAVCVVVVVVREVAG